MRSWEPPPFSQWADIHRTERFISIQPRSGYLLVLPEDDGHIVYLSPDASDEVLGRELLAALDRSRFIRPADEPGFFKPERYMPISYRLKQDFMRRYGYKTKREAYRAMDWCRAERSEGRISIQPHKREKPEYWRDLPPEKTVVIPSTKDPVAVGAALRVALDRGE